LTGVRLQCVGIASRSKAKDRTFPTPCLGRAVSVMSSDLDKRIDVFGHGYQVSHAGQPDNERRLPIHLIIGTDVDEDNALRFEREHNAPSV
jgi:hypothetical protein